MKPFSLFILLNVLLCSGSLAENDSKIVDPSKIEVSLVPDQPRVPLGEPTYLSFTVKNNSDRDLQVTVGGDYRNRLGRPESFMVSVTDRAGTPLLQTDAGWTAGGMMVPKKVPASGTYSFRLFLPDWAIFDHPDVYHIHAERKLRIQLSGADLSESATALDVHASATIEILPADPERMGKLIDSLGERILRGRTQDDREPLEMLDAIRDERAIPYYLKALRTNRYELKFEAIRALARFNSDEALNGLKEAMMTSGADIGHTTTPELAEQSADQIRHSAAVALQQCPHPESIPLLLLHDKDRSAAVRLDVVHAIANKLKPADAIPRLKSMSGDTDEKVSREAARYLKEIEAKK